MGLWKLLKNTGNSEGIREAMRMSYDKHFNLATEGRIPGGGDDPHQTGLYGALASRLRLSGVQVGPATEPLIWVELLPFTVLDKATGREALAEYVVFKECPADARMDWLKGIIRKGIARVKQQEETEAMMMVASANGVAWLSLCDDLAE